MLWDVTNNMPNYICPLEFSNAVHLCFPNPKYVPGSSSKYLFKTLTSNIKNNNNNNIKKINSSGGGVSARSFDDSVGHANGLNAEHAVHLQQSQIVVGTSPGFKYEKKCSHYTLSTFT